MNYHRTLKNHFYIILLVYFQFPLKGQQLFYDYLANQSALSLSYTQTKATFLDKEDLKLKKKPDEVHRNGFGVDLGILSNNPRNDYVSLTYGFQFSYYKSDFDVTTPHTYTTYNEKKYVMLNSARQVHNYLFGFTFRWNFYFSANRTRPFIGLGWQVVAPVFRSAVVSGQDSVTSNNITFRDNIFPQDPPYAFFMPELTVGLQQYLKTTAFMRVEFYGQAMLQNFFNNEDYILIRPFYGIRLTYAFKNRG